MAAIFRGRRITRDPGLLALLDELERRINTKVVQEDRHHVSHRGLKGGPGPPSPDDHRIKKALYQRLYMRRYRAKKKAEKIDRAEGIQGSMVDDGAS